MDEEYGGVISSGGGGAEGFGDYGAQEAGLFDEAVGDQQGEVDFLGEGDGSGEGESGGVGGGSGGGGGGGADAAAGGGSGSGERGIKAEHRITTKFMTKYEKARILGTRALQLR